MSSDGNDMSVDVVIARDQMCAMAHIYIYICV